VDVGGPCSVEGCQRPTMYQSHHCYKHKGHKHEAETASPPTDEDSTHEQQRGGEDLWWTEENEGVDEPPDLSIEESTDGPSEDDSSEEGEQPGPCRFFDHCNNMVDSPELQTCAECSNVTFSHGVLGFVISAIFSIFVAFTWWDSGDFDARYFWFYLVGLAPYPLGQWRLDLTDPASAKIERFVWGFFAATVLPLIIGVVLIVLFVIIVILMILFYVEFRL